MSHQYEAIFHKTLEFSAAFLVFQTDLVLAAEPLWQK